MYKMSLEPPVMAEIKEAIEDYWSLSIGQEHTGRSSH